jgi:hypothetical protein
MQRLRIALWNTASWFRNPQGVVIGFAVTVAVVFVGRWIAHSKGSLVKAVLPTFAIFGLYVVGVFLFYLWQAPRRVLPKVLTLVGHEITEAMDGWAVQISQNGLGIGIVISGPGPLVPLRCSVQDKHGDTRIQTAGGKGFGAGVIVVPMVTLTYPIDWSAPLEGGTFTFAWTWVGIPDAGRVVAAGWFKAAVRPHPSNATISPKDQT